MRMYDGCTRRWRECMVSIMIMGKLAERVQRQTTRYGHVPEGVVQRRASSTRDGGASDEVPWVEWSRRPRITWQGKAEGVVWSELAGFWKLFCRGPEEVSLRARLLARCPRAVAHCTPQRRTGHDERRSDILARDGATESRCHATHPPRIHGRTRASWPIIEGADCRG
ncbi:hypothetical protein BC567DRAFT_28733 [Phyllosticta citribraziliensis]